MTPAELVQEILDTHHALLHAELPRLDKALAGAPEPLRSTWFELSALMVEHLSKEEGILFPTILALCESGHTTGCGVDGPVAQMRYEHQRIEALVAQLEEHLALAGDEQEALATLLDDLKVHAAKEDERLFPAARALTLGAPVTVALARLEEDHHFLLSGFLAMAEELEGGSTDDRFLARFREVHEMVVRHLGEEEELLMPALSTLAQGQPPPDTGFETLLAGLQTESAEVEAFAEGLYRITDGAGDQEETLVALLDRLLAHARFEEEDLFPVALRLLEAWAPSADEATAPTPAHASDARHVLRRTRSPCPECLELQDADVAVYEDRVELERTCPEHGPASQLLSRAPGYWVDLDRYFFKVNPGAWPQRDYIVRMTEQCNLNCPICLARANDADTADLDMGALERLLEERQQGGLKIDLMAAEPTLRDDLEEIVRDIKAAGHIAALHTNGLKLAHLPFAQKMADAGVDEVFLQFDGFNEDANKTLRGRPLLKARLQALKNCRKVGLSTSLIAVIAKGVNEEQAGEVYRFALRPENDHVREVLLLGLRELGGARDLALSDNALMPDELIDLLADQHPELGRDDVRRFNKLYFAMLSAFKVRKCLYVQHYLVARDGKGNAKTFSDLVDLNALEVAAERYARDMHRHPIVARARLLAAFGRAGLGPAARHALPDLVRLQHLFRTGMNLKRVPRRFLLLGFITACDPLNFDAQVALQCGKGELSTDGGLVDSGAWANLSREQRVAAEREGGTPPGK